jgi:hypothetical protein
LAIGVPIPILLLIWAFGGIALTHRLRRLAGPVG